MNDQKKVLLNLAISVLIPLIAVTLGGLIVYGTPSLFFNSTLNPMNQASDAPAVMYYGLSFVLILMYFLMRQRFTGYEFVAYGLMSLAYSLTLKKHTPMVQNPLLAYMLPMLLFFTLSWVIMKYVFLNPKLRQIRLLIFAVLNAAAFSLAFYVQFLLLRQITAPDFLQTRFMSGIMLFIFLGFGFTVADFIMCRMEKDNCPTLEKPVQTTPADEDDEENKMY